MMFESDDFDQILSQFDFPDGAKSKLSSNINEKHNTPATKAPLPLDVLPTPIPIIATNNDKINPASMNRENTGLKSPRHSKRRIINSYFDHNNKRKFPGPAGILAGNLQEPKDEEVCQIELLSQDIDFTQNHLREIFDTPLWYRILGDVKTWNMPNEDSIKSIKQHALVGGLRRRKAQTIVAFIETIDRSVTDPLITLRDKTGSIKCTLHRDAWSAFSQYIVPEYCALVLWKPTILTTGSAFKKHYLNITLGNIYAIYSSVVLKDEMESKELPEGYNSICEEDCTIIKCESPLCIETCTAQKNPDTDDIYDELDSIFSDDIF